MLEKIGSGNALREFPGQAQQGHEAEAEVPKSYRRMARRGERRRDAQLPEPVVPVHHRQAQPDRADRRASTWRDGTTSLFPTWRQILLATNREFPLPFAFACV
jgi:hypothetical protein